MRLKRVKGIGDAAYVGTTADGSVGALTFLDSTYLVTVKGSARVPGVSQNSFGGPGVAGLVQALEGFAKAIIPLT